MESAVSFAPLRPADFVDFAGRGGAGQPVFPRGGASIPGILTHQGCISKVQASAATFTYSLVQNDLTDQI